MEQTIASLEPSDNQTENGFAGLLIDPVNGVKQKRKLNVDLSFLTFYSYLFVEFFPGIQNP